MLLPIRNSCKLLSDVSDQIWTWQIHITTGTACYSQPLCSYLQITMVHWGTSTSLTQLAILFQHVNWSLNAELLGQMWTYVLRALKAQQRISNWWTLACCLIISGSLSSTLMLLFHPGIKVWSCDSRCNFNHTHEIQQVATCQPASGFGSVLWLFTDITKTLRRRTFKEFQIWCMLSELYLLWECSWLVRIWSCFLRMYKQIYLL